MLQAAYNMILFFLLLCLRGWELPTEMAKSISIRARLTDLIAGKLMGTRGSARTIRRWNELEHTA